MSPLRPRPAWPFPRLLSASPWAWPAALLAAALPGALLICILHCTLPAGRQHHGHATALFVCDQGLAEAGDLPPPLSATLVQSLVQGLGRASDPVLAGLILLGLAATADRGLRTRPADGPPVPPPRCAA